MIAYALDSDSRASWRDYEHVKTSWGRNVDRKVSTKIGKAVSMKDIPGYFNDYYFSCLDIYNNYLLFGMPYSGGWAEQPEYLLDIVKAFKAVDFYRKDDGNSRGTESSNQSRNTRGGPRTKKIR